MNLRSALLALLIALAGCEASALDEDMSTSGDDMSMSEPGPDGGGTGDAAQPTDSSPVADLMPATCAGDLKPSVSCGRCGTASVTCVDGKVVTGACMGEHGDCVAGTVAMHPDGCMHRKCNDFCRWEMWTLNAGAFCTKGMFKDCTPGPSCGHQGRMDCLPTGCKYGPCYCP